MPTGRRERGGDHRDRGPQRADGAGRGGAQQGVQGGVTAVQPARGEQADGDMGGEQQPGAAAGTGGSGVSVWAANLASGVPNSPRPHSRPTPTERSGPVTGPPAPP